MGASHSAATAARVLGSLKESGVGVGREDAGFWSQLWSLAAQLKPLGMDAISQALLPEDVKYVCCFARLRILLRFM